MLVGLLAQPSDDARASRVEHLIAASWCATVDRSRSDRCDPDQRRRALRWVAGATTRSGFPRAIRIAMCGRPQAAVRDGDNAVSWRHKPCGDRACPCCAQQRSRQLAVSIRRAVGLREGAPLYFLTLTRPRMPGQSAVHAWADMQRSWEALRHRPEFKSFAGGCRILEAPGNRRRGWHVHYHCIVELKPTCTRTVECPACRGSRVVARRIGAQWRARPCKTCSSSTHAGDGRMAVGLAELLAAWCGIVGGALVSQCAVPLDDANAGQLAKYVTKMWELDDESARELFAAAEGKRLLNTFGDWRAAPRRGHLPPRAGLLLRGKRYDIGARRWWLGPLVADIERMHPRTYVSFEASVACKLEGEPTAQRVGKGSWRPTIVVKRMTARAYLRQLADDQRRADQHSPAPPDTPTPGADMVAAASGSIGPWSMRARALQRVARLQLERKLAPVGPVVDVKPGDCGKRAWPPWAVEREQLGLSAETAEAVAGELRRLRSS